MSRYVSVAQCLSAEDFVVVCDSILNLGLMTPSALMAEFGGATRRFHRVLNRVDGRAESRIETMVRLRLRAEHIHAEPQVVMPMVGRMDSLVGTSLIIEVDGTEHHLDTFDDDRLRDLQAHSLGYHPIRLTYKQVIYQWAGISPLILDMIARGDHMRHVDVLPLRG